MMRKSRVKIDGDTRALLEAKADVDIAAYRRKVAGLYKEVWLGLTLNSLGFGARRERQPAPRGGIVRQESQ